MDARRNTWEVAVRLAVTLSVAAAAVGVALSSLGLAQPAIVLGVIVVGFATSWVQTGRAERLPGGPHPVVTVPRAHFPVG